MDTYWLTTNELFLGAWATIAHISIIILALRKFSHLQPPTLGIWTASKLRGEGYMRHLWTGMIQFFSIWPKFISCAYRLSALLRKTRSVGVIWDDLMFNWSVVHLQLLQRSDLNTSGTITTVLRTHVNVVCMSLLFMQTIHHACSRQVFDLTDSVKCCPKLVELVWLRSMAFGSMPGHCPYTAPINGAIQGWIQLTVPVFRSTTPD
jgi:hypothetical protein